MKAPQKGTTMRDYNGFYRQRETRTVPDYRGFEWRKEWLGGRQKIVSGNLVFGSLREFRSWVDSGIEA